MNDYIIGLVKSEMNGKMVPFMDLTDAPIFMKTEEKPQLLDEFIVTKIENSADFDFPWNLKDTKIQDFMKNGHILAAGKVKIEFFSKKFVFLGLGYDFTKIE